MTNYKRYGILFTSKHFKEFMDMKTIANILWFIFGGFIAAVLHFVFGIAFCATIVLIPFGVQHFKLGSLVMCPFGKTVTTDFDSHPFLNIIWTFFGGIIAIIPFILGVVFCLTVVLIPFGKQFLKLARLAYAPFGATVEN